MKISDSHNDFLTEIKYENLDKYLIDAEKNKVINLLCSYFTTEDNNTEILQKINKFSNFLSNFNNCNYKLHIEDVGFLSDKYDINTLINCKPFSVSLTWNFDNRFAGGNFGISGLTKKGKLLTKLLNKNNIIIDVAHLNKKSFRDIINISDGRIFCSHTGINCFCNSERNLSDNQIKTIIDSGGYFGLFLSPKYMSTDNKMSAKRFAKIIFIAIEKYGYKNFGIGSDFFGMEKEPYDIKGYHDFFKVACELNRFGVNNQIIDYIFYKNFNDFKLKLQK